MNTLQIPCKGGEISDGFHTFDELYEHRTMLYIALLASNKNYSWISKRHCDDSQWENWFVAGLRLRTGEDITYHIHDKYWDLCKNSGVTILDKAPKWDGHTSADVLTRLKNAAEFKPQAI